MEIHAKGGPWIPEEILPQELLMEKETEAWQCLRVYLPFQFDLCFFHADI